MGHLTAKSGVKPVLEPAVLVGVPHDSLSSDAQSLHVDNGSHRLHSRAGITTVDTNA